MNRLIKSTALGLSVLMGCSLCACGVTDSSLGQKTEINPGLWVEKEVALEPDPSDILALTTTTDGQLLCATVQSNGEASQKVDVLSSSDGYTWDTTPVYSVEVQGTCIEASLTESSVLVLTRTEDEEQIWYGAKETECSQVQPADSEVTDILTFPQLIGQFLFASPAAWAFSRFTFRGRNLLFTIYTILMLLPFQVLMVPDYLVLDRLGLMDTVWSIILPGAVSTFPVFIMKKGFDGIPVSVLEAAELDGAGAITTYIRIGLPLGIPGILSALLLSFIEAWNAIEQPLVFLKSQNLWPMSLFLANITQDDIGIAMVASVFMLLPVILIFLFGQRYLILGIQSSGVKE